MCFFCAPENKNKRFFIVGNDQAQQALQMTDLLL